MRVLVTGSRTWSNMLTIRRALIQVEEEHTGPFTLVHGDARGADHLAEVVAERLGWEVERHPADWSQGKRAGLDRNQRMINFGADLCLAFIRNGSAGASHCAGRAHKAGIPVRVFDNHDHDGKVG